MYSRLSGKLNLQRYDYVAVGPVLALTLIKYFLVSMKFCRGLKNMLLILLVTGVSVLYALCY
jgi:hypothetical protein